MNSIETSFGRMATIMLAGHRIEVLEFVREGRDHTHDVIEHAVCLSGPSELILDGVVQGARIGVIYIIHPGVPHRMRPTMDEPSVWMIWYSKHPRGVLS